MVTIYIHCTLVDTWYKHQARQFNNTKTREDNALNE